MLDPKTSSIGAIGVSILAQLVALDNGERAEIRRGKMTSSYWRIWTAAGIGDVSGPRAKSWDRMIRGLCTFIGTNRGAVEEFMTYDRIGTSLANAGFSEIRFARLINSSIDCRPDLLDRALVMMARKSRAINVRDLAQLYLFEDPMDLRKMSNSYYTTIDSKDLDK